MRVWHIVAVASAALSVFGFLVFRILNLEQRVETLYAVVHGSSGEIEEEGGAAAAETAGGASLQRIQDLESKVEKLQGEVKGLSLGQRLRQAGAESKGSSPSPLGDALKSSKLDEYILSVVRDEATRLRDETVDIARDVWVQHRAQAVHQFALEQELTAAQEAALQRTLEDEVYKIVEAFRSPERIDDPEQAIANLLQTLKETDEQVGKLLTKEQTAVYLYLRRLEQQTMMPWLPK